MFSSSSSLSHHGFHSSNSNSNDYSVFRLESVGYFLVSMCGIRSSPTDGMVVLAWCGFVAPLIVTVVTPAVDIATHVQALQGPHPDITNTKLFAYQMYLSALSSLIVYWALRARLAPLTQRNLQFDNHITTILKSERCGTLYTKATKQGFQKLIFAAFLCVFLVWYAGFSIPNLLSNSGGELNTVWVYIAAIAVIPVGLQNSALYFALGYVFSFCMWYHESQIKDLFAIVEQLVLARRQDHTHPPAPAAAAAAAADINDGNEEEEEEKGEQKKEVEFETKTRERLLRLIDRVRTRHAFHGQEAQEHHIHQLTHSFSLTETEKKSLRRRDDTLSLLVYIFKEVEEDIQRSSQSFSLLWGVQAMWFVSFFICTWKIVLAGMDVNTTVYIAFVSFFVLIHAYWVFVIRTMLTVSSTYNECQEHIASLLPNPDNPFISFDDFQFLVRIMKHKKMHVSVYNVQITPDMLAQTLVALLSSLSAVFLKYLHRT